MRSYGPVRVVQEIRGVSRHLEFILYVLSSPRYSYPRRRSTDIKFRLEVGEESTHLNAFNEMERHEDKRVTIFTPLM